MTVPAAPSSRPTVDSATGPAPLLRIDRVSKAFGGMPVVDDVSLDIWPGELFSLLGPSGCGKSTLLRILAGLETPTAGRVVIDGTDVTGTPPYERPVNMMFQSYALFPHMTVSQNVAFGLTQDGWRRAQVRARVDEMLALVRLEAYAGRRPHQLSGGQRQRVALARALARHPKLLLLDEPLAALDRKLREQTQFELMAIQARVGITFIMVTHDQDEAMTMSSRVAVMDAGRILQIGAPATVYEYPASRHVAEFIGSVNILEGRVTGLAGEALVIAGDDGLGEMVIHHGHPLEPGARVAVAIRPEKITLTETLPADGRNGLPGVVAEIGYHGDVSTYHVRLAGGRILRAQVLNAARTPARGGPAIGLLAAGQPVVLTWTSSSGVVLTA